MRIALASDHVGLALKTSMLEALESEDFAVLDLGTHSEDPVDYPAIARAVANAVNKGFVDIGILVCDDDLGGAIAANKCAGIRAGACDDTKAARRTRERLDTNVLCLGGADLDADRALAIAHEWLRSTFAGEERDARAIEQIRALERAGGSRVRARSAPPAASAAPAAPAAAPPKEVRPADITAVLKWITGMNDVGGQVLARRVVEFVRNRFPEAAGTPTDDGFTFALGGRHLLSAAFGRACVDLQVGPDRIAPRRIRDTEAFDTTMALPTVANGFETFS